MGGKRCDAEYTAYARRVIRILAMIKGLGRMRNHNTTIERTAVCR